MKTSHHDEHEKMDQNEDKEEQFDDGFPPKGPVIVPLPSQEKVFNLTKEEIAKRPDLSDEEKMKLLFDTHTIEMPSLTPLAKYSKKPVFEVVKRAFDIFASFLGIIVLSPLLIIVSLIIKCQDGGSVLFIQNRVGRFGRKFKMYKFRSMCPDADKKVVELIDKNEASGPMLKIKDDPRITKFGRFIRKTSIDELPQLFNVLFGSMSLVGPRPALPREVTKYTRKETARLLVKPGITCTWQVSGRSNITFDQQVDMDIDYIVRRSVWFDLKLLVLTIPAVLSHKGAE